MPTATALPFFKCFLGFNRIPGIGDNFEAFFFDLTTGQLTDAVQSAFNPGHRLFDFIDQVLLAADEVESKLPVKIIGALVGHMQTVTAQVSAYFAL